VETFLNVALLVQHDFSWFASTGVNENPGTKCVTVTGAVANPGIIEVPIGASIHAMLFDVCGGESPENPIKAVHVGGPLGGYVPPDLFDQSFDHDTLEQNALRMGTSTLEVLDQSVCIVDRVRKHFLTASHELCRPCTAGREGIYQISAILCAVCNRQPVPGCRRNTADVLVRLRDIANYVKHSSMCVYCEYAISSLLTSMQHFPKEYEDHLQKRCQAGVCF
jgi:NADH:ubiquinone oxidoreductase subunit F (NADH-binding)